ncbi:MAG: YceI family protein [Desulfotalea sp.]
MKNISVVLAFLVSLFFLQTANSATTVWKLDKAHSNFFFSVDHIYSKVQGYFSDFSGEVNFDPDMLEKSKFEFNIKVKSINTGIGKRDKHLLSKDFFNEAEYPELKFVSKKVVKVNDSTYNVHGKFVVKGKEYDLVLPLDLVGIKDHPMKKGSEVAGFSGMLTIDRVAYGIGTGKFVDFGVVGKNVDIFVSIEVLKDK